MRIIFQIKIPKPTIARLCLLYQFLEQAERNGVKRLSSSQIGEQLGFHPHNIRKDIGYLGEIGNTGAGYNVIELKNHISQRFGLDRKRNACVVGLGRLGRAILNLDQFVLKSYKLVAGFDSNINKLETMKTKIDLFPSSEIIEIVRRRHIELAVITVPARAACKVADQLVEGGVKGIVNFCNIVIKPKKADVFIRNISVTGEFHYLSALITLNR